MNVYRAAIVGPTGNAAAPLAPAGHPALGQISVVTSDHRHAQIAVDAVAAGVRGVFCEKPIATTLADADRMIAATRGAGVPLVINHSRRWYPELHDVRRLIRGGTIGPLRRIVATLGGPRAMLFRNGTHLVDTICFRVGFSPPPISNCPV